MDTVSSHPFATWSPILRWRFGEASCERQADNLLLAVDLDNKPLRVWCWIGVSEAVELAYLIIYQLHGTVLRCIWWDRQRTNLSFDAFCEHLGYVLRVLLLETPYEC